MVFIPNLSREDDSMRLSRPEATVGRKFELEGIEKKVFRAGYDHLAFHKNFSNLT